MYCSVKFLSPMVTAGLPLPGAADDCEPVDDLLLLLEPHAANDSASAAAISAAMLRNQVRVVTSGVLLVGVSTRAGGLPAKPPSGRRRSRCGRAARAA